MKKYQFRFVGRQAGAIGITYPISDSYKAKDIHEAMSLLYEDYELLQKLSIKENGKDIEEPEKINFATVRSNRERKRKADGSYITHRL